MNNLIKGDKHDWEMVIGLEVHAQVKSNSKLFSSLQQNLVLHQIVRYPS